ncbi:hypothetical protein [Kiloniella laminariae]|uniref:hypothetical protein n=1 Tax=Kiloniella laminariae TaxID=454162 RepID=UPI000375C433|nr:hypothetical protein [Kiloniella laminariae]
MAKLDMDGPFPLEEEAILRETGQPMPGSIALGYLAANRSFEVLYVDFADTTVQEALLKCLKKGIGKGGLFDKLKGKNPINAFKFSYAMSVEASYQKSCKNFHEFGGTKKLNNKEHPRPPRGKDWACDRCTAELSANFKIKTG